MLRRRGLAAAVLAGLILASVLAAPSAAKKKQNYRFSFATKLQADWQWPVNQFNHNQRDTDGFQVQSGTGCGTKPSHAIWKLRQQNGDTGQLPPYTFRVDLVHGGTKNPAPVTDANYPGVPTARVQFFLKFPSKKTGKLTLSAKPTGDVAGMTITPPVALKAKKVKHC